MRFVRFSVQLLLVLGLLLSFGAPSGAQTNTPTISKLTLALWPEYDDPRVLVIITGQVDEHTTTIQVPIPQGAEINAVAYMGPDQRLLKAEWEEKDGVLTIQLPSPIFHLEYYADFIQADGNKRTIIADVPLPLATIQQVELEVQQPAQTKDFSANPPLEGPKPGRDELSYWSRTLGPQEPGSVVHQEVRYTRLAPGLSASPRTLPPGGEEEAPAQEAPAPAATPATSSTPLNWPLLIAAVVLLLATGGGIYYWMRTQEPEPLPRAARKGKKGRGREKKVRATGARLPKYCPNCGHPFGPHDKYCAMCGAKRE
ncbi:MAG: zinc ribbon domain-containing protein [Chloroflexi bacterium]|nr:zinc ribbon domain-containing protein [Chloroflexota bacterium]